VSSVWCGVRVDVKVAKGGLFGRHSLLSPSLAIMPTRALTSCPLPLPFPLSLSPPRPSPNDSQPNPRYGNQSVPVQEEDERYLSYYPEKGIKLLGFVDAEGDNAVPRCVRVMMRTRCV
jgi:hypothetical protein